MATAMQANGLQRLWMHGLPSGHSRLSRRFERDRMTPLALDPNMAIHQDANEEW
jgi:hypothetical protein